MRTNGVLECEEVDTIFAMSEQKVTRNLIRKKMVTKNAYFGKIPDDERFPLGSGTRIKGFKLGKIGVPDCTGWRPVEDELCATNACAFEPDVIQHGHGDYFFSLVQKDLRTDWLCIDSLAFREMASDEIMHLEEGLQNATRYVHEEFRRSRYILFCRNKIGSLVSDSSGPVENEDSCSEPIDNFFVFGVRDNGEMDECTVYVQVDPNSATAGPAYISELSLDLLDYAQMRLEYEDDVYLDQTGLYDVLLAEKRMGNRLALQESANMDNSPAQGGNGWNLVDLRQNYGTDRVLRDYSLRTDIHSMRFYPAATQPVGPFDANDPNTWTKMERVFPYIPVQAKVAGVEYVTNPAYLRAPFGISTILNRRVMSVMSFPNVVGVGGARKVGGFGYEGTAQWQNPDWPCNVNRDKGFWKLRFRMAAKQNRDEEGYAYFHRIDHRIKLVGNPCTIPTPPCVDEVTPYCFSGMGGASDPTTGENRAQDQGVEIPTSVPRISDPA